MITYESLIPINNESVLNWFVAPNFSLAQKMTRLNFQNSFWGPGDRGFPVLLNRMKKAKKTTEEIQLFLKERVMIEEEYAKKLSKLAKNHLFNDEIGYFFSYKHSR